MVSVALERGDLIAPMIDGNNRRENEAVWYNSMQQIDVLD